MKLGELIRDVSTVTVKADLQTEITGVSCDSKTTRPGEVFVAVKGYTSDGHKYIKDAVNRGVACIVCNNKPDVDVQYIIVEDSRKALALISAAWFNNPAGKLKMIGVTGTNGKTTVTYLIKHIIEKCSGSKVGLIGTIGNLIGERELETALTTPDSYDLQRILGKMVLEGCRYVIMEVSSHALYLHRVYGIEYDIGIFTNLTAEHLDFHLTMEEYAKTKAMLFEHCNNAIINIDDKYADYMTESFEGKPMRYATDNPAAELIAKNIDLFPGKTEFDITVNGTDSRMVLHIPGLFSVYNALAATAAGLILGYDAEAIGKALFTVDGVKGRAEVLPINKKYTVLVDYAHTPDALENIIKTARSITDGNIVTLFGCGGDRDKSKRPVMGKIATQLSDIVIITSDNPRTENPGKIIEDILGGIADYTRLQEKGRLKVIENRREAIYEALNLLLARDVLIIAGKGHETYQILGNERIHFDDREVVEQYLKKNKKGRLGKSVLLEGIS